MPGLRSVGLAFAAVLLLPACGHPARSIATQHPAQAAAPSPQELAAARPSGVSQVDWDGLVAGFRRALEERTAAVAIRDLQGEVIDFRISPNASEEAIAVWTHRAPAGDYNRDGEVNAADLTPLATHLGLSQQKMPDWKAWDSIRHIDGDGNGEINLADVSVLGHNFGRRNEGYELQHAAKADGPWAPLQRVAASEAVQEPRLPYPQMEVRVVPVAPGEYFRVVPFAGDVSAPLAYFRPSNMAVYYSGAALAGGWRFQDGDAAGTARSDTTGPAEKKLRWLLDTSTEHTSSEFFGHPVIAANGTCYVPSQNGIAAISPSGEVVWNYYPGGNAVALSPDGTVYAYGRMRSDLNDYNSPMVETLVALSPQGVPRWSQNIDTSEHYGAAAPLLVGDRLFLNTDSGLTCRARNDGGEIWTLPLDAHAYGSCIADNAGNLYCLRRYPDLQVDAVSSDGIQRWSHYCGSHAGGLAVRSEGTVLVASDAGLCSFASDGTPGWIYPTADDGSLALDHNDNAYVVDGALLTSVDPAGNERWTYEGNDSGTPDDLLVDGADKIYVSCDNGHLRCLDNGGNLVWDYRPDEGGSGDLALGDDGALYQLNSGKVFCFASDGYGVPNAPQSVTSSNGFPDFVRVEWAPVPGATGYEIGLDLVGTIASVSATETHYDDYNVYPNRSYSFYVQATNVLGRGPAAKDDAHDPQGGSIPEPGLETGGAGDWRCIAGNQYHQRRAVAKVARKLHVVWTYPSSVAPVFDALGRAYILANDNDVRYLDAVDTTGGTRLWRFSTGDSMLAPAIGVDGTIYLGHSYRTPLGYSWEGDVIAISQNRELVWSTGPLYSGSSGLPSAPAALTPTSSGLVVLLRSGGLLRFDLHGNQLSSFQPEGSGDYVFITPPAVDKAGRAYFNVSSGVSHTDYYAVSLQGELLWEKPFSFANIAPLTLLDAQRPLVQLFGIGAVDGAGEVVWNAAISSPTSGPAVGVDGVCYSGLTMPSSKKVIATNPDGSRKWALPTTGNIAASPVVDGAGNIYVIDSIGRLYCMSAAGSMLWYIDTDVPSGAELAIGADGKLYIPGKDGVLRVYGA